MSDANKNTTDHKALVKAAIHQYLSGETQETALEFVEYLHENDMTTVTHPHLFGNLKYICKIKQGNYYPSWILIEEGKWHFEIFNYSQFETQSDDDADFIAFVNSQVKSCTHCHEPGCGDLPDNTVVFGETVPMLCFQHSNGIKNPTVKDLEHFKKLLAYSKDIVHNERIWHPNHL